nr:MAG TPA: hypothetical protein [Caudoviricetes sp.]
MKLNGEYNFSRPLQSNWRGLNNTNIAMMLSKIL